MNRAESTRYTSEKKTYNNRQRYDHATVFVPEIFGERDKLKLQCMQMRERNNRGGKKKETVRRLL